MQLHGTRGQQQQVIIIVFQLDVCIRSQFSFSPFKNEENKGKYHITYALPFEDGSFIYVDYTTKNKDDGKVFETTVEEVAKSAGIYREGDVYGPRLVVLGQGWVTKGFEEALRSAELGKEARVEVPYDKGYGPRDPRKERHYSMRAFEKGEPPRAGALVEVNGEVGTVLSVGGGRVLIDFNDPRAGKTLVYEFVVREKLEKDEDKIKALVHRRFPGLKRDDIVVVLDKNSCTVQLPESANLMENAAYYKAAAARDINKYFPNVYVIHFVDTYMFKAPQQPAQQAQVQVSSQKGQQA
ncbi:MAG TPA: peptidylprolyl isomerase, partial [Thermoprotei archaeon]|nr:peptidylprolyl isomerase [Thermoprotei archaeon]